MMQLRPRRRGKAMAAVDWAAVHQRLARIGSGVEAELGAEQAEALLAQRAAALAAPLAAERRESAGVPCVVAEIATERYAIESAQVWRVMALPALARLPGAPEIVLGVANLHGEVLPVFDPRRLLGLGGSAAQSTRILVLGSTRADFGLAVDAVHEVTAVLAEQLLPPPDPTAPEARALLRGVRADGLIVLDGSKLMTDARLRLARTEPA